MLFIPKARESCRVLGKGRNIPRELLEGEGTGKLCDLRTQACGGVLHRGTSKGPEDLLKVQALWRMWEVGAALQRLPGTHGILSGTAHGSG